MGRGLSLQDPMALNSRWERLAHEEKLTQGRGDCTEARARTAVMKNDMKNDLRRQKVFYILLCPNCPPPLQAIGSAVPESAGYTLAE